MKYLWFSCILVLMSCASIPKQAPDLSAALGKEINVLEKSHLSLLHAYFDERKAKVDEFIETTWLPQYATNFFSDPEIQDAWNEIVASDDKAERLDFILAVAPELQVVINEKRKELITPLDEIEEALESSLRDQYNYTRSINNSLTSFLSSAWKVQESQQRYLDMVKITDDKIGRAIDRTDEVVEGLLKKAEKAVDVEEKVADYKAKAEEYSKKLKGLKEDLLK
jgi:hypothetical protein